MVLVSYHGSVQDPFANGLKLLLLITCTFKTTERLTGQKMTVIAFVVISDLKSNLPLGSTCPFTGFTQPLKLLSAHKSNF